MGFLVGLAAVVAGAELLVRGASRAAAALGISPLVIGLTVVAYGTSAPELAVSLSASASGRPDLAVANVVGSNVFNVLAIVGLCAVVAPVAARARVVRREIPVMVVVTLAFVGLAADGAVTRLDGVLLLVGMVVLAWFTLRSERTEAPAASSRPAPTNLALDAALVLAGLVLLVAGARWLVGAATATAAALGVSELVIGLTVVAAGTSVPELATSLVAVLRGQRDIAIGNIVGSNLFNVLGILGISALAAPGGLRVVEQVLALDAWVMLGAAAILLPMAITGAAVVRWEGVVLLVGYVAYTAVVVAVATGAIAVPAAWTVTLAVALPVLLVAGGAWRQQQAAR
ncbi:calcium/sodium antiporter [soil metagenome]